MNEPIDLVKVIAEQNPHLSRAECESIVSDLQRQAENAIRSGKNFAVVDVTDRGRAEIDFLKIDAAK